MAVRAASVHLPRGDVWHGPLGPVLALALVTLPFAAALLWAMSAQPATDPAAVQRTIAATADHVRDHAASMAVIGERIATAARASTAPERDRWISYGEHLMSDAKSLDDLEARLRRSAAYAASDPVHSQNLNVAAAIVESRWEELRADGRATSLHGTLMAEQAVAMAKLPHAGIATDEDLRALEQAAVGMHEAGERTVKIASELLASVSQAQRGLGIWR